MRSISRRDFVALTAAGAAATPFIFERHLTSAGSSVTAQQIVDRVKANIGVEWGSDDVDTFKVGDPATVVTGVATTSMATLDVLQKAVQAGANFIITAAPTFYSRADASTLGGRGTPAGGAGGAGRAAPPAPGGQGRGAAGATGQNAARGPAPSPATASGPGTGASAPMPPTPLMPQSVVPSALPAGRASGTPPVVDPVYAGKNAFIEKHKLVVFRLTQHWNQRKPDPRALGVATAMGWTKYQAGGDALRYDLPGMTLEALASQLKKTLNVRGGIRVIGDRGMTVRKVGLLPGYTVIPASIAMMPGVDAIVAGEVQEWESAAYAQDVVFAGLKKGFISIGRVVNESPGMQVCADWLRTIVSEVPTRFIPAGDPVLEATLMATLTAGEVVNRIKALMAVQGVPWSDASTRDRFKFGGPETVVTGIATTFMGTFEAISHAAERGLNMIIPHEDTYWNDPDNTLIAEADTLVYRAKIDFMTKHGIVVFRIHDHMHRQRPDFTFSGTAREVGLDPSTETAPNSHRYVIPETTLGELAARVKRIRGDDAIRVVGDPAAKVSRIATGAGMATPAVNDPDVDVVIGGEQREIEGTFDSPEYVMDAATLGVRKGWIVIGHNMSEESGMQEMADWLKPIVPEVKVQHVRAGIVYWVPK